MENSRASRGTRWNAHSIGKYLQADSGDSARTSVAGFNRSSSLVEIGTNRATSEGAECCAIGSRSGLHGRLDTACGKRHLAETQAGAATSNSSGCGPHSTSKTRYKYRSFDPRRSGSAELGDAHG